MRVQTVPIKHLSLETNWGTQAGLRAANREQKQTNSKHFLFMRVLNHQRKASQHSIARIAPACLEPNEQIRPKTSLLKFKQGEQLVTHSMLVLPQPNPEQPKHRGRNEPRRLCTPCSQPPSEGLKNYFPQRKPKRNKDYKWHQYFTLLTMKQFTIEYAEEQARNQPQSANRKGPRKVHRRAQSSQVQQKRRAQGQKREQVGNIEISPWHTGDHGAGSC